MGDTHARFRKVVPRSVIGENRGLMSSRNRREAGEIPAGYLTPAGRIRRQGGPMETTTRFAGTFVIDAWEPQEDADTVPGTARVSIRKTFAGDLVGTSRTQILTFATQSYCGFEVVEGTVAGRTGTFALRHAADAGGGEPWMTWTVLDGSGTGELTGVRGEGQIDRADDGTHSYWLELTFGPTAG
jgi:Protein of unknown function (DUF3224)